MRAPAEVTVHCDERRPDGAPCPFTVTVGGHVEPLRDTPGAHHVPFLTEALRALAEHKRTDH